MNSPLESTWKIDPGHSAIHFKVRHMAFANIAGAFNAFTGTVQTNHDDFTDAQVQLEIEAASLSTNNEVRDDHLKSAIFFDVQRFPKLTFRGVLQKLAADYQLTGMLTIGEIAKEVVLPTTYAGTAKDLRGNTRAAFELTGSINRFDFGLTWNMLTEIGSLVVGENVKLLLAIELLKEEVAPEVATELAK